MGICQQLGSTGLGGVATVGGSGINGIPGATCVAFPPVVNGQLIYSMGGTIGPFQSGTTATLTCNIGFTVNTGIASASCQVN